MYGVITQSEKMSLCLLDNGYSDINFVKSIDPILKGYPLSTGVTFFQNPYLRALV